MFKKTKQISLNIMGSRAHLHSSHLSPGNTESLKKYKTIENYKTKLKKRTKYNYAQILSV